MSENRTNLRLGFQKLPKVELQRVVAVDRVDGEPDVVVFEQLLCGAGATGVSNASLRAVPGTARADLDDRWVATHRQHPACAEGVRVHRYEGDHH